MKTPLASPQRPHDIQHRGQSREVEERVLLDLSALTSAFASGEDVNHSCMSVSQEEGVPVNFTGTPSS